MFAVALLAVHAAGFGCAISRVGSDGANNVKLLSVGSEVTGLGLNLAAGKMYWSEIDNKAKFMGIRHANLDGSGVGDTLSTPAGVADMRVDSTGTYIYFTEGKSSSGAGAVRRFNINTGKVNDIVANEPGNVFGLDIDEVAGKVYWVQSDGEKVRRADFNGSNVETILKGYPPLNCPIGLALDGAGQMYITDIDDSFVSRIDTEGKGNLTQLLGMPDVDEPGYIRVDKAGKKLYFAENEDGSSTNLGIFRVNLDGSALQGVKAFDTQGSAPSMQGLDIDSSKGLVYYIACGGDEQEILMI